jgi:amidase
MLEVDGRTIPYRTYALAYPTLFNLTGNPVVVLSIGRSAEGMPIGVQIVGRRWRDMELLAVAERVSEVTGGFQPPPGF